MKLSAELLESVGARVLEDAAYVLATRAKGPRSDPPAWDAQGVRLTFEGPLSGYCELWSTPELIRLLAANMLGVTESDPAAETLGMEALGEAINILCGSLLTELAGVEPVFRLGAPTACGPFAAEPEPPPVEVWIDVEGCPVCLRARVTDPLSKAA